MAGREIGAGQPAISEMPIVDATPITICNAAADAEKNRFGKELQQDVQSAGADRHAQPDLPVRSVTDTSRMFMMLMPPTTRDIEATAASRSAMMRLLLSAVSAIWLKLRT